jgi:hypothetical protein
MESLTTTTSGVTRILLESRYWWYYICIFWWYVPKKNRTPDTSQKCTKKRTNLYFKTFKTLLNMLYLCIPCESLSSHTHWASPDEDSPIHGLKFGERCQVPLGVTGTLWTLRKVQLMRSGLAL